LIDITTMSTSSAGGPGAMPGPLHAAIEQAFDAGLQLFNRGQHWHAHEAWEQCWRLSGDDRYKGLIQTAAALVKLSRGEPRGHARNWLKAQRYLAQLPPNWRALDIPALRQTMDALLADPGSAAWPWLHAAPEAE
jgi:predicted metal-dependent hydrolase